jgi:hypothetical protein
MFTIGPVQEKETIANAKAINNIPIIPPLSDLTVHFIGPRLGSIISNAPKNEAAKPLTRQKMILNHTLVDKALRSAPKIQSP